MKSQKVRQNVLPVVAALIWGTAFSAQSVCTAKVPPLAFNAIRSIIAAVFLFCVSRVMDAWTVRRGGEKRPKGTKKDLILGGICCGAFLAVGANLQQAAIANTAVGKAGFLTALYVVLVPVLGTVFGRRAGLKVWIGVAVAVAGLWFLCINGEFRLQTSDIYLLVCALFFACQILCVDHFVAHADGVMLSCVQFATVTVISAVLSAIFETPTLSGVTDCILPILYVSIFSSGIAYTLQIIAQKGSDPTIVTLLLSLESVFAVLGGAVLLGDRLSGREYLGCVLMLIAVVLAQLPEKKEKPSGKDADTGEKH